MLNRMLRASALDPSLYEEVEADQGATGQAMTVIVLSSVASGFGSYGTLPAMVVSALLALVGWFTWAFATYIIGTRVVPEPQTRASFGELLRVTGYSAAPGVLRVFGFFEVLADPLYIATGIWMLAAMIIALRQALDYSSTARAVVVAVIGWIAFFALGWFGGLLSDATRAR
jgi:hypothetical protein